MPQITRPVEVLPDTWRGVRPILICSIWCTPYLTGMYGTRPFLGGTGRRAVAHTRPDFAKNALGPVGIPLVRGASGAGQWTQPPRKGVKAWGEGPLRPKEISRYRDTLGQIHAADNTAGRSATRHLERCQTDSDLPLWQQNLSVLITVRRVHYGEMGTAPTTDSFFFS